MSLKKDIYIYSILYNKNILFNDVKIIKIIY